MRQFKKAVGTKGRTGRSMVPLPKRSSHYSRRTHEAKVDRYSKRLDEYQDMARALHRELMKEESGAKGKR